MPTTVPRQTFRFGDFELDTAGYELRRLGRRVRLGRQPMDLLILLVQKRRDLVSRGEIVEHLWGKDVFVDVDTGVNTAISRVRQALRDAPDAPTFLETVAGRGYRFIASVEAVAAVPPIGAGPTELSRTSKTGVALAVLPFEGLGSDPERAYLAAGLTDETSASLAQIDPTHLSIKGRTQRYKDTTKTVEEIAKELSIDYLVQGSIRMEGARLRVTVMLIRMTDEAHVWSQSYEREPTSLLGFQQELSAAIAKEIRLVLSPDRMRGIGRRQTQDAEAHDTYLRVDTRPNAEPRRATPAPSSTSIGRSRSMRTTRWRGQISHLSSSAGPSTATRVRLRSVRRRVRLPCDPCAPTRLSQKRSSRSDTVSG